MLVLDYQVTFKSSTLNQKRFSTTLNFKLGFKVEGTSYVYDVYVHVNNYRQIMSSEVSFQTSVLRILRILRSQVTRARYQILHVSSCF